MITRMPSEMKQQLEEFAERNGISVNAAVCLFVANGLRADKRRGR